MSDRATVLEMLGEPVEPAASGALRFDGGELRWSGEVLTFVIPAAGVQARFGEREPGTVQLSRDRERPLLHMALRTLDGRRLALVAEVDDAERLAELPEIVADGARVEFGLLLTMLRAARALGVEMVQVKVQALRDAQTASPATLPHADAQAPASRNWQRVVVITTVVLLGVCLVLLSIFTSDSDSLVLQASGEAERTEASEPPPMPVQAPAPLTPHERCTALAIGALEWLRFVPASDGQPPRILLIDRVGSRGEPCLRLSIVDATRGRLLERAVALAPTLEGARWFEVTTVGNELRLDTRDGTVSVPSATMNAALEEAGIELERLRAQQCPRMSIAAALLPDERWVGFYGDAPGVLRATREAHPEIRRGLESEPELRAADLADEVYGPDMTFLKPMLPRDCDGSAVQVAQRDGDELAVLVVHDTSARQLSLVSLTRGVLWSVPIPADRHARIMAERVGDILVVVVGGFWSNPHGAVIGLDPATGSERWRYPHE